MNPDEKLLHLQAEPPPEQPTPWWARVLGSVIAVGLIVIVVLLIMKVIFELGSSLYG